MPGCYPSISLPPLIHWCLALADSAAQEGQSGGLSGYQVIQRDLLFLTQLGDLCQCLLRAPWLSPTVSARPMAPAVLNLQLPILSPQIYAPSLPPSTSFCPPRITVRWASLPKPFQSRRSLKATFAGPTATLETSQQMWTDTAAGAPLKWLQTLSWDAEGSFPKLSCPWVKSLVCQNWADKTRAFLVSTFDMCDPNRETPRRHRLWYLSHPPSECCFSNSQFLLGA